MKILSFLCTLVCLGFSTRMMAYDATETKVSNTQEFLEALSSPTANIRLTADIDLSNVTCADNDFYLCSTGYTFKGRISGETPSKGGFNYVLKNASRTFFIAMEGATIEHLVISNCKFSGRDTSSGWIADDMKNCTLDDIIFNNVTATGDFSGIDCDRMGAATGTAEGCTFTNLMFVGCKLITDGERLGMVAGQAKDCTFNGCVNNLYCDLWADGNTDGLASNAYVGGICGYADHCTLNKCYNYGVVSSDDDRTGGIIGYGTNGTTLTDCQNSGVVSHSTKDGFGRAKREEIANNFYRVAVASGTMAFLSHALLCSHSLDLFLRDHFEDSLHKNLFDYYDNVYRFLKYGNESNYKFLNYKIEEHWLHNGLYTSEKLSPAIFAVAFCPVLSAITCEVTSVIYLSISLYNVVTQPDEIGGIAGKIDNSSKVLRCTNGGPVNGADEDCGGIVGHLEDSSIESCYNRTFVTGGYTMLTGKNVGGIVGYCKNGTINGNLNVGPVTALTKHIGNIEGTISGTYSGTNNYYLAEADATNGTASVAFTQEKLPSGYVAKVLNDALIAKGEKAIWRENLGVNFYPVLNDTARTIVTATTEDYSIIQNIYDDSEFYFAIANPNAQISLQNDIDLKNFYFNCSSEEYPFKGVIKGNSHTISNASYEASSSTEFLSKRKAFFPFAKGAKFGDLTINNFHITHKASTASEVDSIALLVAVSNGCQYDNIRLTKSSILLNSSKNNQTCIAGLVAVSNGDTFTDCTVDESCQLQGSMTIANRSVLVGGIASVAHQSTFQRCRNAGTIYSDGEECGGVAAHVYDSNINLCLNTGTVTGDKYAGGIAGQADNTSITKCVNTGTIDFTGQTQRCHGGVAGYVNSGSISDCLSFGEIKNVSGSGMNNGAIDGGHASVVTYGSGNYYYCTLNNELWKNEDDNFSYAKVTSGEFAQSNDWLYQSIDNDPFCTKLPVPIPEAGKVYSNVLCDNSQSQSYSNYYKGEQGHTTSDFGGLCSLCGRKTGSVSAVSVGSVRELKDLAQAVNRGVDYSKAIVMLTNDIDMKDVTDFIPIGIDRDHAFSGIFRGNGHRIKNLTLKRTGDTEGTGLFGNVTGTTEITDLVIDSTCVISSAARGAAGIVGILTTPTSSTSTSPTLTLERCGNEASVTDYTCNAAGLVGAVYYNDDSKLYIRDCYNTGYIAGAKESAALVGFGNKNLTVVRCWNASSVSGCDSGHSMIRYADGADTKNIYNNYQLKGDITDINAKDTTSAAFNYGGLCKQLNVDGKNDYASSSPVWGQNIGTEPCPVFSTEGLHYTRSMANQWGTICLPFGVNVNADDDYDLYELSGVSGDALVLRKVSTSEAGKPYIIRRSSSVTDIDVQASSGSTIATTPVTGSSAGGLTLTGAYTTADITDKDGYIIANNAFWNIADIKGENKVYCSPFRAWLAGSLSNGAKQLNLGIGDEITGIGDVLNSLSTGEGCGEAAIYDLNGHRLNTLQPGVNIVKFSNGTTKKIILK